MMKNKRTWLVIWLIFSLSLFSAAFVPAAGETTSEGEITEDDESEIEPRGEKGEEKENDLDLSKLEVGDIILTRGSKFDYIVPGEWTHAIMYVGDEQVVESIEEGVVTRPVETVHSNDEAAIFRVSVNQTVKEGAVDFALDQEGKFYNPIWFDKRVHGGSYYCSELVWASYMVNGICIDENPGWSWTYANGVAPTELADHSDTSMVEHGK